MPVYSTCLCSRAVSVRCLMCACLCVHSIYILLRTDVVTRTGKHKSKSRYSAAPCLFKGCIRLCCSVVGIKNLKKVNYPSFRLLGLELKLVFSLSLGERVT